MSKRRLTEKPSIQSESRPTKTEVNTSDLRTYIKDASKDDDRMLYDKA